MTGLARRVAGALALASILGLAGCVVAPPWPVYAAPGPVYVDPPVYAVPPTYVRPSIGFVWTRHPRYGYGWHHPHRGWHRGWR